MSKKCQIYALYEYDQNLVHFWLLLLDCCIETVIQMRLFWVQRSLLFEQIQFFDFWPKFFALQYVARPYISQNSSCSKSRLLCTQKRRIRTTVSTQQLKERSEKSSKKCLKWDISLKGTNFGSSRTISQWGDLGSFFGLLCWDRGLNTLLLSIKKPTFRTTWILTYKGLSNILTPLGVALTKLGSI